MAIEKVQDFAEELGALYQKDEDAEFEDEKVEEGFWEEQIESHFSDYSMQYFLTTLYEQDEELTERMPALIGKMVDNKELITFNAYELSMSKLEDLCHELNVHNDRRSA